MHDCNEEYWRHCIHCVVADPDAEITEWSSADGLSTYTEVTYPDGEKVALERGADGWEFKKEQG